MTGWVPWYTLHNLYAGLRNACRYCGNAQARTVLETLADWAVVLTQNLSDNQFQRMLETEHSGMAESMADVYALLGQEKCLALARHFAHHAVFDPPAAREDKLDGLHSNTQIPKMIGSERVYQLSGERPYHAAPQFFWQTVTKNRSYASGGSGDYERFSPAAEFAKHVHSDTATKTCSTYNMLKLTRAQFCQNPLSHCADYYERALFNDILALQDPQSGMMIYCSPLKPGHFRVCNDPASAFWRCVGTGMENHAKYGDSVYFHRADEQALYVNLVIASTLHWRQKGLTLTQHTAFLETNTTRLTLSRAEPTLCALKIRRPLWIHAMTVTVNGKPVAAAAGADGYVTLHRTWRTGDSIAVTLSTTIRLEPLPRAPEKQVVLCGPLLLAGAIGQGGMDNLPDIQRDQAPYDNLPALEAAVFVGEAGGIASRILPVPGQPIFFRTQGLARPAKVTLVPHYKVHHQRFNTY